MSKVEQSVFSGDEYCCKQNIASILFILTHISDAHA